MTIFPLLRSAAPWIGALCCLPGLAMAQSLAIRVEPAAASPRWNVVLEGQIEAGAADRVAQELSPLEGAAIDAFLDSPGGSLIDGVRIGSLLRRLGATTTVGRPGSGGADPEPGRCLSACTMAFLGGVVRHVPEGAAFGVHRAATPVPTDQDFDAGQIVSARIAAHIREMGASPRLFELMAGTGKDRIRLLDRAELRSLRVVSDGRQPAEWRSESSERGPSIVGTQETAEGAEKAVFRCDRGSLVFQSFYRAGANAALVAGGQWIHSLTVGGTTLPLDAPVAIADEGGILDATFELPPEAARRIVGATSVGHTMQGGRGDPAALGYRIDIEGAATQRVWSFVQDCTGGR